MTKRKFYFKNNLTGEKFEIFPMEERRMAVFYNPKYPILSWFLTKLMQSRLSILVRLGYWGVNKLKFGK